MLSEIDASVDLPASISLSIQRIQTVALIQSNMNKKLSDINDGIAAVLGIRSDEKIMAAEIKDIISLRIIEEARQRRPKSCSITSLKEIGSFHLSSLGFCELFDRVPNLRSASCSFTWEDKGYVVVTNGSSMCHG